MRETLKRGLKNQIRDRIVTPDLYYTCTQYTTSYEIPVGLGLLTQLTYNHVLNWKQALETEATSVLGREWVGVGRHACKLCCCRLLRDTVQFLFQPLGSPSPASRTTDQSTSQTCCIFVICLYTCTMHHQYSAVVRLRPPGEERVGRVGPRDWHYHVPVGCS